jgi:hypothetical protein
MLYEICVIITSSCQQENPKGQTLSESKSELKKLEAAQISLLRARPCSGYRFWYVVEAQDGLLALTCRHKLATETRMAG